MLKWVFGADTGPFRQGLAQMRSDVSAFSGSIKGQLAGAFASGAILAGFKTLLDHFGRIQDLADRFGTSAVSIQKIGNAAELAGSDVETAGKALTVLTKSIAQAENGNDDLSDSFRVLGTTWEALKSMTPEDQLVAISRGYTQAGDQAQALNAVMKVLGKGGAELVPLLTQGPEALKQSLDDASASGNRTVAVWARIGDEIDKAKQAGVVFAGDLIPRFQSFLSVSGAVIGGIVSGWIIGFQEIAGGAVDLGKAISSGLSGDFANAGKALESLGSRAGNIVDRMKGNIRNQQNIYKAEMAEIWNPNPVTQKPRVADSEIADANEAERTLEKRKRLEEEIAKLEEDAKMRSLSLEEQILELKLRQKEAAETPFALVEDQLEARKQELEIARQIADLEKQKQEIAQRDGEQVAALSQSLADAVKAEAEIDKENRRAAMSDEERLVDLKKEQADLMKQAAESEKTGDYLDAIQKRTQAKGMNGEINALQSDLNKPRVPAIVADDMRRWGGSTRYAEAYQPGKGMEVRQDKTNELLQSIDRKLPERSAAEQAGTPF